MTPLGARRLKLASWGLCRCGILRVQGMQGRVALQGVDQHRAREPVTGAIARANGMVNRIERASHGGKAMSQGGSGWKGAEKVSRRKGVRNRFLTRVGSLGSFPPMGRPKRADDGGLIYHVLNRANARLTIFENDGDYEAFERVLEEAVERTRARLLAYCVLPNHWHLIVWPRQDGELSRFVGWLTLTHTQRWHAHRHSRGSGHVYQGDSSPSWSRATSTFSPPAATSSATLCGRTWSSERKTGAGAAYTVRSGRRLGGHHGCRAWPLERPTRWVE
jgi:REP element-mobilizing transposase RayT